MTALDPIEMVRRDKPEAGAGRPLVNRSWPFNGGGIADLGQNGRFVEEPLRRAGRDEIVARVDAVCICASDIKIMRMGAAHPLFANRDLQAAPVVLGHEMALTVMDVGEAWRERFHVGERLGLQPAITAGGRRHTVGIDLPGGFAQYVRLDGRVLGGDGPFVFPIPSEVAAATVAMLEPYSCVEAAFRQNCRTTPRKGGSLLLVCGAGADDIAFDMPLAAGSITMLNPTAAAWSWAGAGGGVIDVAMPEEIFGEDETRYDDIIIAGAMSAAAVARLERRLAPGGLMALVATHLSDEVTVDAARIHYQGLSHVGAPGPSLAAAFDVGRNRFEVKAGGVALILGAGGAMGRIHTLRALAMADGPSVIIATSRQTRRCQARADDFAPMAEARGKSLIVVEDGQAEAAVRYYSHGGCDDVIVAAPDAALIERGAALMKANGMLVLFAGLPFGKPCRLPLGLVATHGARFTGSSGSTVTDQLAVLKRVTAGTYDLSRNLDMVGGLPALPEGLAAVAEGRVSGKIAIYPALLDLPLTPVAKLRSSLEGDRWTLEDERHLSGAL